MIRYSTLKIIYFEPSHLTIMFGSHVRHYKKREYYIVPSEFGFVIYLLWQPLSLMLSHILYLKKSIS